MKLLITTQAVDLDDPVLGFFHRWLVEFSKHCESIHVICLKEGRHELPANVFVHSLGKESGASRLRYVARFYRYIWKYKNEYDTVFVHMNPEYIVLGGLLWRIGGKRIGLWYVHKSVSVRLRIAAVFTNTGDREKPFATEPTAVFDLGLEGLLRDGPTVGDWNARPRRVFRIENCVRPTVPS